MSPETELAACRNSLRANRDTARRLLDGVDVAAAVWRPAPGKWSMAECLHHLVRTGEAYAETMERCVADGRAAGRTGTGPFRHGRILEWLIGKLEPSAGGSFKAPGKVAPAADLDPVAVAGQFEALGERWERLAADADGLDLSRNKLRSPVLPIVRMDLGQALRLMDTHERRHLAQAERVRRHEGFPGPGL